MNTILGLRHVKPTPAYLRIFVRHTHGGRKPKRPTTGFQGPPDHGLKIYVFSHRRTEQTIYSFRERLDGFHDLKQLPFNGKKTKPAKLRKDYWSTMAVIRFPENQGVVGRSVFQKLRELKHLHEVSWPEELRLKSPEEYTLQDKKIIERAQKNGNEFRPIRSKHERGLALNAQKANSIADMAAVLAGAGRGNRMVKEQTEDGVKSLYRVTVEWQNSGDKSYAEEWSKNVVHGQFKDSPYRNLTRKSLEDSKRGDSGAAAQQPSAA